jgi:UDP-glucose 4-epimerase
MKAINVALIGANGFIGRHVMETLMKKEGVNLFLFGKGKTGLTATGLLYNQLDLTDAEQIKKHFELIDAVYYLASETIPVTSWENPILEIEKNLKPFIHFTECVLKLRAKKIIFVSSAGTVYGSTEKKVKEDSLTNPFSPYGIIKLTMEHFLNYFHKKYNISFDIFRVSNVYGDGQDTSKGLGIINTFLEKIISEKKVTIFGNGDTLRNYVYVKDVAELLALSLDTPPLQSHVYNLSTNDTLSINTLINLMRPLVSEKFEIIYKEIRQSDNPTIDLDNSKILNTFPQFKFTSIEEGISKTYQHLKKMQ